MKSDYGLCCGEVEGRLWQAVCMSLKDCRGQEKGQGQLCQGSSPSPIDPTHQKTLGSKKTLKFPLLTTLLTLQLSSRLAIHMVELVQGMTTPPKEFNDASLLTAMESAGKALDDDELTDAMKEKGLGTPATRSGIIETLLKREFIARKKNTVIATEKGCLLIDVLGESTVASVELTAEWEHKLSLIEKGEHCPTAFVEHVTSYMKALVT